jgi:uncharacterized membrane protein YkoI
MEKPMHDAAARLVGFVEVAVLCLATAPATGTPVAPMEVLTTAVNHSLVSLAAAPTKIFVGEAIDAETGETFAICVEETVQPRSEHVVDIDATVVDAVAEDVRAADEEEQAGAIDDGQGLLSAAAITLEESIVAAQAAVPGEIGEIDLEVADEGIILVVDVGSNEVNVDAETGLVLSIVAED